MNNPDELRKPEAESVNIMDEKEIKEHLERRSEALKRLIVEKFRELSKMKTGPFCDIDEDTAMSNYREALSSFNKKQEALLKHKEHNNSEMPSIDFTQEEIIANLLNNKRIELERHYAAAGKGWYNRDRGARLQKLKKQIEEI